MDSSVTGSMTVSCARVQHPIRSMATIGIAMLTCRRGKGVGVRKRESRRMMGNGMVGGGVQLVI